MLTSGDLVGLLLFIEECLVLWVVDSIDRGCFGGSGSCWFFKGRGRNRIISFDLENGHVPCDSLFLNCVLRYLFCVCRIHFLSLIITIFILNCFLFDFECLICNQRNNFLRGQ